MPDDHPFETLDVSGWLTTNDRRYLLGEKTYEDPAEERRARQRLRERIRHGLQDCMLLVRHLEPRDRHQLLADVTTQVPTDPADYYREDSINSLVYALAFLYMAAEGIDLSFETLVERGLHLARYESDHEHTSLYRPPDSVDVTIETHEEPAPAEAAATLCEDPTAPLPVEVYWTLIDLIITDVEEFVALTSEASVNVEEARATEETLTPGESLLLVGRGLADPSQVDLRRAIPVLDPDVRAIFNLDPREPELDT